MWRSVTCGVLRAGDLIRQSMNGRQLIVLRAVRRTAGRVEVEYTPADVTTRFGDSDSDETKAGRASARALQPTGHVVLRWED